MILVMIGATELLLISGVVLLMFGGKKLPELMKGMGKGIRSFKEGMSEPTEGEITREVESETNERRNLSVKESTEKGVTEDGVGKHQ